MSNRVNMNANRDGLVRCGIHLEIDFTDEGIDREYDEDPVLKIAIEVLKPPYSN